MARQYPTLTRNGFLLPERIKASYEGAGEGRRSASWDAPDVGINSINTPALRNLRARSRAAVRNDPYAFNVIDKRVSNLIGTGITPRPKIEDDALRKLQQELWEDWVDESDADGLTDFYGQQALIARTVETAGECFVRIRPRSLEENLAVPLQLQVLAPEFVPHDKFEPVKNGNSIRAGIEFNPAHQRVAYWMYRVHPRDASSLNAGYNQLVRVPAAQVLHIFEPVEPGQLRGVPRLAPVLKRLRSLDNYDDAVLFRQEVANLFAGFISRPPPEATQQPRDPVTGQLLTEDRDGFTPMVALEPGTMQELGPGEEVEFSKPPDAGNNYPDFMRQQLMAAAAGTGTPTKSSPVICARSTTGRCGLCSTNFAVAWSNCNSGCTCTSCAARCAQPGWTWPCWPVASSWTITRSAVANTCAPVGYRRAGPTSSRCKTFRRE